MPDPEPTGPNARTRIKICGITTRDAALAAVDAGADAVGFVFVRSSPRFIEPEAAAEIMLALPPMVASVGVFMNHDPEEFAEIEELCPTTHSQLHGSESRQAVQQCAPVIKGLRYAEPTIGAELDEWDACEDVEALLVDGPSPGEGVAFTWEALRPHLERLTKPVFLAGGLTAQNVGDAVRVLRPYAVDVSSGVERERGVKDPALIAAFCRAVRQADRG